MSGGVASVGRAGTQPGASAPSNTGPAPAPQGATGEVSSMPGRGSVNGGKAPKVHESEFTKAAHLGLEAQESRLGASASGATSKENTGGQAVNADPSKNPAAVVNQTVGKAGANAERISEL
jgi:hypothetical protein